MVSGYLKWAQELYIRGEIASIPINEEVAKKMLLTLGYITLPKHCTPLEPMPTFATDKDYILEYEEIVNTTPEHILR